MPKVSTLSPAALKQLQEAQSFEAEATASVLAGDPPRVRKAAADRFAQALLVLYTVLRVESVVFDEAG